MRNKVKYNTQNSYLSMCDRHNYLNFKILTFVQSVYSFDLEYGPFRAFFFTVVGLLRIFFKRVVPHGIFQNTLIGPKFEASRRRMNGHKRCISII